MKRGNSKWAYFSYSVDGKNIYLKNRIHVSMSTKIVEKNKMCDKRILEKLYGFSVEW